MNTAYIFFIAVGALVAFLIIREIITRNVFIPVSEEIPEKLDINAKVTEVHPYIVTIICFSDGYICSYDKTKTKTKWLGRRMEYTTSARTDLMDKMVEKAIERHKKLCEERIKK